MQYFLDTIETIPEGQGFSSFGPVHLAWLAGFVVFAIACSLFYRNSSQARRKHIRWLFAALLLADEAFKIVCLLVGGNYRASYLPLHMCSINIFLIALHALRPTRLVDNFLYAVCIPAALAALLFPTWVSLPPANFMHLHSFTVHILLATYPIMLTAGRDIRPQAKIFAGLRGPGACPGCPGLLYQPGAGHQFHVPDAGRRRQPAAPVRAGFRQPPVGLPGAGGGHFCRYVRPALLPKAPARPACPPNSIENSRPGQPRPGRLLCCALMRPRAGRRTLR